MNSNMESSSGEPIHPIQHLSLTPAALLLRSTVCVRQRGDLAISNQHLDRTVRIISIASNDSQFQIANFSSIYLGPSNLKFLYVMYLPLSIGRHTAAFTLKTSDGDISYIAHGIAEDNKYRVNPIVSLAAASKAIPLTIPILLYNPHNETLKILDISSSASSISLTDFPGDRNISIGNWIIPPQEERSVVTARLRTDSVGEQDGRIDIQTSIDLITIPVTVSVIEGGIIATPSTIDFGKLDLSSYRARNLQLRNLGNEDVLVSAILIIPYDLNLHVSHRQLPILIPRSESVDDTPVRIASLTYTAVSEGYFDGYITLTTNSSYQNQSSLQVQYRGSVSFEGIGYDVNVTSIMIAATSAAAAETKHSRNNDAVATYTLTLRNNYRVSMSLTHLAMADCSDFLQVVDFVPDAPVATAAADAVWELQLEAKRKKLAKRVRMSYPLPFKCDMLVETNSSSHRIPIYFMNESLRIDYLHQEKIFKGFEHSNNTIHRIDMGSLGPHAHRSLFLVLTNPQPINARVNFSIHDHFIRICHCALARWSIYSNRSDEYINSLLIPATLQTTTTISLHGGGYGSCSCMNSSDCDSYVEIPALRSQLYAITFQNTSSLDAACDSSESTAYCSFRLSIASSSFEQNIHLHYQYRKSNQQSISLSFSSPSLIPMQQSIESNDSSFRICIGKYIAQRASIESTSVNTASHLSTIRFVNDSFLRFYFLPVEITELDDQDNHPHQRGMLSADVFWLTSRHKTLWQHSLQLLRIWNASHSSHHYHHQAIDELANKLQRVEPPLTLVQAWFQASADSASTQSSMYDYRLLFDTYITMTREIREAWRQLFPQGITRTSIMEVVESDSLTLHRVPFTTIIDSPLNLAAAEYEYSLPPGALDETIWMFVTVQNVFAFPMTVSVTSTELFTIARRKESDSSALDRDGDAIFNVNSRGLLAKWMDKIACRSKDMVFSNDQLPRTVHTPFNECHNMTRVRLEAGHEEDPFPLSMANEGASILHNIQHFSFAGSAADELREDLRIINPKLAAAYDGRPLYVILSDCDSRKAALPCSLNQVLQPTQRAVFGPIVLIPGNLGSKARFDAADLKKLSSAISMPIANNYTGIDVLKLRYEAAVPRLLLQQVLVNASEDGSLRSYSYPNAAATCLRSTRRVKELTDDPSFVTVEANRSDSILAVFIPPQQQQQSVLTDLLIDGLSCRSTSMLISYPQRWWRGSYSPLCDRLPLLVSSNDSIEISLDFALSCSFTQRFVEVSLILQADHQQGLGYRMQPNSEVEIVERYNFLVQLSAVSVARCINHPDHRTSAPYSAKILYACATMLCLYSIVRALWLLRASFTSHFKTRAKASSSKTTTAVSSKLGHDVAVSSSSSSSSATTSITAASNTRDQLADPQVDGSVSKTSTRPVTKNPSPQRLRSWTLTEEDVATQKTSPATSTSSPSKSNVKLDLALDWRPSTPSSSSIDLHQLHVSGMSRNSSSNRLEAVSSINQQQCASSSPDRQLPESMSVDGDQGSLWRLMNSPARAPDQGNLAALSLAPLPSSVLSDHNSSSHLSSAETILAALDDDDLPAITILQDANSNSTASSAQDLGAAAVLKESGLSAEDLSISLSLSLAPLPPASSAALDNLSDTAKLYFEPSSSSSTRRIEAIFDSSINHDGTLSPLASSRGAATAESTIPFSFASPLMHDVTYGTIASAATVSQSPDRARAQSSHHSVSFQREVLSIHYDDRSSHHSDSPSASHAKQPRSPPYRAQPPHPLQPRQHQVHILEQQRGFRQAIPIPTPIPSSIQQQQQQLNPNPLHESAMRLKEYAAHSPSTTPSPSTSSPTTAATAYLIGQRPSHPAHAPSATNLAAQPPPSSNAGSDSVEDPAISEWLNNVIGDYLK
jgi:hypothetical protein